MHCAGKIFFFPRSAEFLWGFCWFRGLFEFLVCVLVFCCCCRIFMVLFLGFYQSLFTALLSYVWENSILEILSWGLLFRCFNCPYYKWDALIAIFKHLSSKLLTSYKALLPYWCWLGSRTGGLRLYQECIGLQCTCMLWLKLVISVAFMLKQLVSELCHASRGYKPSIDVPLSSTCASVSSLFTSCVLPLSHFLGTGRHMIYLWRWITWKIEPFLMLAAWFSDP